MRMLIGAACFAGITSAISSVECMAPHLSFVSQSISGVTTSSVNNTLATPFTEKTDFETFNMVFTNSATIENHFNNETWTTTANVTQIMDMGERRYIMYEEIADASGGHPKICMSQVLPDSYNPAALASFYRALTDAAVCSNNDGTYDTWKISKSFQPLPALVDLEYMTTQDSLWHSVSESIMLNGEGLRVQTSVSTAEAGGPSAADLDPAKFDVECQEIPTPPNFNVNTLFSSKVPGVFRKHVLAALHMALAPQQMTIVA